MEARQPIDFCPAAALASEIGRLELLIEIAGQLSELAARSEDCAPLLRGLEAISEDLLMAAEDARARLAEAEAVSSAGAIAQLLAALRDQRVHDEDYLKRCALPKARSSWTRQPASGSARCGLLKRPCARRWQRPDLLTTAPISSSRARR
jgi:hypothetical protein